MHERETSAFEGLAARATLHENRLSPGPLRTALAVAAQITALRS